MVRLFEGSYDPVLSCALADEYQNGCKGDRELLQELLLQVAPLVGIVASTEIKQDRLVGESLEGLKCDALTKLFEEFEDGGVPTDCVRSFTSFLYTSIKRAMIDTIRRSAEKVIEPDELLLESFSGRVPGHREVEARIHLRQLTDLIKSLVENDCRFVGPEKDACCYMALCELGYMSADPMAAQYKFSLTRRRTKALLKYTRVLVKTSLYYYKDLDEDS